MKPGWIEFTRIPRGASTRAAALVMPRTAHLLATQERIRSIPIRPSIEEMLRIDPPPAALIGSTTARMPRKTPVWLTSVTRR